jgi:hypothetical protein
MADNDQVISNQEEIKRNQEKILARQLAAN